MSTDGAGWPRWRRDGKELIFLALGNGAFNGEMLSAAVTTAGGAFEAVAPKPLVLTALLNLPHSGGDYHPYDVSADGQRLLIFQYVNVAGNVAGGGGATFTPDPGTGLVVALNWASSLKK